MDRRPVTLAAVLALLVLAPAGAAEWRELSPATSPSARAGHTMVAVGGTAYLYGGKDAFLMPRGDLWRFDRAAETWVQVQAAAPAGARFYHSAVEVGGRMLVGNGYGTSGILDDFWLFDPATGQWTLLPVSPTPPARYLGMMAAVDEDTVFVGGGFGGIGTQVLTDAWLLELPPRGNEAVASATPLTPLPAATYGGAAAALGGRPAVISGSCLTGQPVDDVYLYDFASASWQQVTPSGEPVLGRALSAAAHWRNPEEAWGDVVVILGGETNEKGNASLTTQVFDLSANTWSYGPDMSVALASQGAAALPPTGSGSHVEVLMFGGMLLDGTTRVDRTFLLTTDLAAPGLLFADDFESGGTLAWSATLP